ncbi:MAG: hypothetical protein P8X73_12615 [Ignavibacteriaceae bacterium]
MSEVETTKSISTDFKDSSDLMVPHSSKTIRVPGCEAVVKSLLAEGVNTIFGYPGGAIMPVYTRLCPCIRKSWSMHRYFRSWSY